MSTNDWLSETRRFEFKIDPENGYFIGPDGCHYQNQRAAMYYSLGMCGCGNPSDVSSFLVACLDSLNFPFGEKF